MYASRGSRAGADHQFELGDMGARLVRERVADVLTGAREAGRRGRAVADHRGEVERERGLIELPSSADGRQRSWTEGISLLPRRARSVAR